jgi:hypothetical protein
MLVLQIVSVNRNHNGNGSRNALHCEAAWSESIMFERSQRVKPTCRLVGLRNGDLTVGETPERNVLIM